MIKNTRFKFCLSSGLLALSMSFAQADELTAYSLIEKDSGKKIVVRVTGMEAGNLAFIYKGKSFSMPIEKFKEGTADEVSRMLEHATADAAADESAKKSSLDKINAGVMHPLFSEVSLWGEKAGKVAERLKWPTESVKKYSSSYRYYPRGDYQFLGAHPYCATLYGGEGDEPQRVSLVFANKGDYGSKMGFGEDHFKKMHPKVELPKSLEEAIDFDTDLITKSLTDALGREPVKQRYGEKEDKREVLRWDYEDHSFLLSSLEGEYVSLLIVPTADADAKGKVKFVKDSDLRAKQLTNLVTTEQGDVYIDNIPMVNQGPKGYCAPATFERAMSYMHIPADMYLLATAATTQEGTYTGLLAENCKRIIRSKARTIKDLKLDKDLKLKTVKKYIDKGVPILWQMRSLDGYNKAINKRSKERAQVTDFKQWAIDLQAEADELAPDLLELDEKHHICLIIGYNEETQELAVSDSWGPAYELRWVHIDIAQAVTSSGGFVIDF